MLYIQFWCFEKKNIIVKAFIAIWIEKVYVGRVSLVLILRSATT